jgi:hypothetical protein
MVLEQNQQRWPAVSSQVKSRQAERNDKDSRWLDPTTGESMSWVRPVARLTNQCALPGFTR